MPCIGRRLVTELHGVLENLHEALNVVTLNRSNVAHERIASDLVPLPPQPFLAGLHFGKGDHVQVRVPNTGAASSLDLVRPHRTGHTIEHTTAPAMLAHPKLSLSLVQVLEALRKIGPILDRESDQKRPQSRFLNADSLPPVQVGFQGLRAPPNGTQRAKQMLHAEACRVKLDLIDGEVVTEQQVIPAALQPGQKSSVTFRVVLADILRRIERNRLCLTVTTDPRR